MHILRIYDITGSWLFVEILGWGFFAYKIFEESKTINGGHNLMLPNHEIVFIKFDADKSGEQMRSRCMHCGGRGLEFPAGEEDIAEAKNYALDTM